MKEDLLEEEDTLLTGLFLSLGAHNLISELMSSFNCFASNWQIGGDHNCHNNSNPSTFDRVGFNLDQKRSTEPVIETFSALIACRSTINHKN